MSAWIYYSLAAILLACNISGFLLNLAGLPGNWFIVIGSGLFCYFAQPQFGGGMTWAVIGILVLLAAIGEVLEFAAGTAGAAKSGGSRRAMALSVVGSIGGSILGAMLGVWIPIPIVGSAIGALMGGATGAAVGAAIGENWKGRDVEGTLQVSVGAFWGRIFGTVGKIAVGAIMVVIATVDSLW